MYGQDLDKRSQDYESDKWQSWDLDPFRIPIPNGT